MVDHWAAMWDAQSAELTGQTSADWKADPLGSQKVAHSGRHSVAHSAAGKGRE